MPADARVPEIFDRGRRRARRDRAAGAPGAPGFLVDHIAADLLDRFDAVQRRFADALLIGASPLLAAALAARGLRVVTADAGHRFATAARGVQADEDRLPFADASFDVIVSAGVLDQVNDLPGALLLARRVLRPDGLFLAGFVGAGSLPRLRSAMLAADLAADRGGGGAAARIHPMVDVRGAGDLLQRAGFALPVADGARLEIRYRGLAALLADLRQSGLGGVLAGSPVPLSRRQAAAAHAHFAAAADGDGRTTEIVELIALIGWAPDPSQPRPARPGSATASLAAALKPGDGRTRTL